MLSSVPHQFPISTSVFHLFPVAPLVKNWPPMQETWVRFLGWEDPLEKGQDSGLENAMDCVVPRVTKSQTQPSDFHFHFSQPQGLIC